jgi:cyclopropane fatty-acyl-phospholipid synthase-like methyltransferase
VLLNELRGRVAKLKEQGVSKIIFIDCGAGVGRHSIIIAKQAYIDLVIAVEKDPEQISIMKDEIKSAKLGNKIRVEHKDVLDYLRNIPTGYVSAVVDAGMSHYLSDSQRKEFANLVYTVLIPSSLYSCTIFSIREKSAPRELHRATIEEQKIIFPENKWDPVMEWGEKEWGGREKGQNHYALEAVLKKRF